jgi:hypothetical protein
MELAIGSASGAPKRAPRRAALQNATARVADVGEMQGYLIRFGNILEKDRPFSGWHGRCLPGGGAARSDGVTPPGGNQGPPGSAVAGWSPDLVQTADRLTTALVIEL